MRSAGAPGLLVARRNSTEPDSGRNERIGRPADQDDTFVDFSHYGADVGLIGPGASIRSTHLNGGYAAMSGTCMATRHVTGGAALYRATHPAASPATVEAAVQAAGSQDWLRPAQDGAAIEERLLGVFSF